MPDTTVVSVHLPNPPDDREEAFARYLELSAPYFEKVEAEGDQLWFSSVEERRELFMRRYKNHTPERTNQA